MTIKEKEFPWGCFGAVLGSVIAGTVALIVASPTLLSYYAASTPTQISTLEPTRQPTHEPTPTVEIVLTPQEPVLDSIIPSVIISNSLALPISISIDGAFEGVIQGGSSQVFYLRIVPARISYEAVRNTDDQGQPFGEAVSGTFTQVLDDQVLHVTYRSTKTLYFYPIISNNTSEDCGISINDGTADEQGGKYQVSAGMQKVTMGYYKLYSNSNVTLYCQSTSYYWGIRSPSDERQLLSLIDDESGVIEFTIP
jgi:hypothetical protein